MALPWNAVAPWVPVTWSCPTWWRWLQRWDRPPRPTSPYHKGAAAAHLIIPAKVSDGCDLSNLKVQGNTRARGLLRMWNISQKVNLYFNLTCFCQSVCQAVRDILTNQAFRTFPMLRAPPTWESLHLGRPLSPTNLTYLVVSSPLKNQWDIPCQDRWVSYKGSVLSNTSPYVVVC